MDENIYRFERSRVLKLRRLAMLVVAIATAFGTYFWYSSPRPIPTPIQSPEAVEDVAKEPTIAARGPAQYTQDSTLEPEPRSRAAENDVFAFLGAPARLDRREPPSLDLSFRLKDVYLDLLTRATAGDADAAFELAQGLAECVSVPGDDDQLNATIIDIQQTRRVQGKAYPVDKIDREIETLRVRFNYCYGISRNDLLDHFVFMKMAADAGHLLAMSNLLNNVAMDTDNREIGYSRVWPNEEDRVRDTAVYLREAADRGSLSAIYALGFQPMDDYIEAAAHRIAGAHLMIISGLSSGSPPDLFEGLIRRWIAELGPGDSRRALQRAKALITAPTCCFFFAKEISEGAELD